MALDATVIRDALIASIEAGMDPIDKDPIANPAMGQQINEALWGAVAATIVAQLQANAEVVDSGGAPTGDKIQ